MHVQCWNKKNKLTKILPRQDYIKMVLWMQWGERSTLWEKMMKRDKEKEGKKTSSQKQTLFD